MTKSQYKILTLVIVAFFCFDVSAQQSGSIYRRSGVLNGNQVKTVFGNWGVIGQPSTRGPRGAWIYDTNGYIGDVSPLVGAEVVDGQYINRGVARDTVFHWVIDVPVSRPSSEGFDESRFGNRQAFEPVSGYFNENISSPAISSNEETWPTEWPDKLNDPFDPGWPGSWNGIFGKQSSADLETYFVLDDNNDNEFSDVAENADSIFFKPSLTNPSRNGLGLEMKVRGLQWQQILAQDNIFWIYEITNRGSFTYPRSVFGMLVGTYVGVTGGDDSPQEYDDDWSFFDVNEDLTYTGDYGNDVSRNPFWQGPVGMVGYAFLESPGNPFDGIDNDRDNTEGSAPEFTEANFTSRTFTNSPVQPGETNIIILINPDNYERIRLTFPASADTFVIDTLGYNLTLISGVTKLREGNALNGNVNANAYDGADNDLDGLIDENYFLHFRQRRTSSDGTVLFDLLNPVRYKDYVNQVGINDEMIDERRDDGIDNDGDWSRNPITGALLYDDQGRLLDDVGGDGLPETGDPGEYDGMPTAGEPNFDRTDKDESDQIGLTSFEYFVPSREIAMSDDEEMWGRLQPGYFDVPETFINGRPSVGEDGDFTYGTGYFPLTPGQTERMSVALLYAWDVQELVKKLQTVRKIYNSDYRFPVAPKKPVLTAVPGNEQVTLYWDRSAESSFDPVLREFDFEGYKIYKATDPSFNDARVVTNSAGIVQSYKPIAEFDLINGISGWYYPPYDIYQILEGWSYNLGNETGIPHKYVDYDVDNGRTYYYAVVSYDRGVDSSGIIPSECTKKITQEPTGEVVLDINTAQVVPSVAAAGYNAPQVSGNITHSGGDGFGTVTYEIIDPTAVTGNNYEIYFWDTSNDGIDNNKNWTVANDVGADGKAGTNDEGEGDGIPTLGEPNFDFKDAKELESITTFYAVKDLTNYEEAFTPNDTVSVQLSRENLVEGSIQIQDGVGNVIPETKYVINYEEGLIKAANTGDLAKNMHLITYQYHPVYFSKYMQGTIWSDNVEDTDIFDGLTLHFDNVWKTKTDTAGSGWNQNIRYKFQKNFEITQHPKTKEKLYPVFFPSNYEVRFSNEIVDSTTAYFDVPYAPPSPRKFAIYNTTGGYFIEYFHIDTNGDMYPSVNERVIFLERDPEGEFTIYTWQLMLLRGDDANYTYNFVGGEVLTLAAQFPFNKFDVFNLQTEVPAIVDSVAKSNLDHIRVVPNPYIVAHEFEPPLPPNITSGRGERRVFFTNVPNDAKVYIFTISGEHVITLEKEDDIFNGNLTWNLKTKENLDIAYGVYLYVVESSFGKKKGKLAVIK